MAEKEKNKRKKPFLYRVIFTTFRIFYKKRRIIGTENLPQGEAIIVGNHAQAHGPLFCEIYFPTKKAIWCNGEVMSRKEFSGYAMADFWPNKSKRSKWLYRILSHILAPIASYVFKKADTIAVYKDARLISTFKNTVKALEAGANVVIFPEERVAYNEIVNDFQDKFVDVAKLYYNRHKVRLSFVPMYHAPYLKTVVFGTPIQYNPDEPIEAQREKISIYVKNEITALAKSLPVHKVVPFENVKKKKYPYSK